jgi:hypothetical protein
MFLVNQFFSFKPSLPSLASRITFKKLIRSKANRKFLAQDGSWTTFVGTAAAFSSREQAGKVANQLKLEDVELYHLFNEYRTTRFDYTLPLN